MADSGSGDKSVGPVILRGAETEATARILNAIQSQVANSVKGEAAT